MSHRELPVDRQTVPLFPLPGVVLFPGAILPLHIFEERYKTMTADALRGRRQITMALLRPGWEKSYYGKPQIEPVVCIGEILSEERLADGKYNFLLQGRSRGRVLREVNEDRPYRSAEIEPLIEVPVSQVALAEVRRQLSELFAREWMAEIPLGKQFRRIVDGDVGTLQVADLIAFNLVEEVATKQAILAEADVSRRLEMIVGAVKSLARPTAVVRARDPSMN